MLSFSSDIYILLVFLLGIIMCRELVMLINAVQIESQLLPFAPEPKWIYKFIYLEFKWLFRVTFYFNQIYLPILS